MKMTEDWRVKMMMTINEEMIQLTDSIEALQKQIDQANIVGDKSEAISLRSEKSALINERILRIQQQAVGWVPKYVCIKLITVI